MVGVSIRTLQYYDEQNLLKPSVTEGGRRRYTRNNLLRLQQIVFFEVNRLFLKKIKGISTLKSSFYVHQAFLQQQEDLMEQVKNLKHTIRLMDTALLEAKNGEEIDIDRLFMIMESVKHG